MPSCGPSAEAVPYFGHFSLPNLCQIDKNNAMLIDENVGEIVGNEEN